MAKKHSKQAGFLIPDVVDATPTPPPRELPYNIGTLLLPKVVRDAARGRHVDPERRGSAHAAFRGWIENLNAGKLGALTETQLEGEFTGRLLAALGYRTQGEAGADGVFTMLPKYPAGGGIADVALGRFRVDGSGTLVAEPKVVVELKGANVDLDRRVGGRTPVEQAWVYLNASETADWAVVSNFAEIRLYHRKGSNYVHRVRMIDLDDSDAFADFYAVLHAESLLGTGAFQHNAAWMLEQTERKQEDVGERLYKEYRVRRKELIRELGAKGYDLERSIAAAQKLLDRVLFVAFAEDRGLLDGSGRALEAAADQVAFRRSKWNNFQSLFEAVDLGDPHSGIPQYNGELFKRDEILDDPRLQLDDKWATVFRGIGQYDFKDEVTEAVLGRIFELSIDDIDALRREGLGESDNPGADDEDPRKTKERRLQGVFYTHAAIVDYLVDAALQPAYEAERRRLADVHATDPDAPSAPFVRDLVAWLDGRTVCDPACGSGAFLSRAYNWFEDRRLHLLNQLHELDPDDPLCAGHPDDRRVRTADSILRNNLYGVDLSGESVEIARLALWIRTARRGRKLTSLSDNVVRGNSVVSDPKVDERHHFDFRTAFPRVFANGGFDAVIGNPPYVRQEHLGPIKEHLKASFRSYHGMADLYVYFYERGLTLLKPGGRLAFVVTNKWMKAGYGEPLRKLFAESSWVESVVDFGHAKQFFKDADVFPCFLVARKPIEEAAAPTETEVCVVPREIVKLDELRTLVPPRLVRVPRAGLASEGWRLERKAITDLVDKIRRAGGLLTDYAGCKPYRGVLTGFNEAFLIDTETKDRLVREDPRSAEILKPYLRGQDIKRWSPEWAGLWMIFTRRGVDIDRYTAVKRHLERFRTQLEPRPDDWEVSRGVWPGRKPGRYAWYEIQDTIDYWNNFEVEKIVFPEITWHLQWSYDTNSMYCNNTAFILPTGDPWILGLLNSPLSWFYSWRTAVHGKDEALRFLGEFVESFPVASPSDQTHRRCKSTVRKLVKTSLDNMQTTSQILDWLKVEFDVADPNTRLRNPIALDSDAFVDEIRKARGRTKGLSVPQLKTLRDEYARSIEPARRLRDEAERLELQIHDLVNEAYGLTPEEIRLMWETAPPRMPIRNPFATGDGPRD